MSDFSINQQAEGLKAAAKPTPQNVMGLIDVLFEDMNNLEDVLSTLTQVLGPVMYQVDSSPTANSPGPGLAVDDSSSMMAQRLASYHTHMRSVTERIIYLINMTDLPR